MRESMCRQPPGFSTLPGADDFFSLFIPKIPYLPRGKAIFAAAFNLTFWY